MTSQCVIEITARTEQFEAAIKQATASLKEFKAALRSIPWYWRLWFYITSFVHGFAAPTAPRSKHVPLLKYEGRTIRGLKRCKDCGLSETYWQRWPDCDTRAGYCLHGDHGGPHVRQADCIDWVPQGMPRTDGPF